MVTLTEYPTNNLNGLINNCFAGYAPINITFDRTDANILSIGQGVNNSVIITLAGDKTGDINVGEYLYYYSEGTAYIYEKKCKVVSITYSAPNTLITVDDIFVETTTGSGYCNYLQDWSLQTKLVDTDFTNVPIIDYYFESSTTAEGTVNMDVSLPVDLLSQDIELTNRILTENRIKFYVAYRELYRGNTSENFTVLVNEYPIILYIGNKNNATETILNEFTLPKLYKGYPCQIMLLHSDLNFDGTIQCNFDELDINFNSITENNNINTFVSSDAWGLISANFKTLDFFNFNSNTKYLKIRFETSTAPDYLTGDYDDNDYKTT